MATNFTSLSNIVSEVLYNISDHETKKYYGLVLQKVLNSLRNINVHYAPTYKETWVELDADLYYGKYPIDLVKLISVGIYKNGEFWPFTRKPDMARTISGDGELPLNEEKVEIPTRGIRFGATGKNLGYWVEDDENRRFFVRNYSEKVLIRYRSNGIDCTADTCIPYLMKDLIVSMVVYDLALMGIPRRMFGVELQLREKERSRHYDEYTDINYLPQNMNELLDAEYASYNTTIRRL